MPSTSRAIPEHRRPTTLLAAERLGRQWVGMDIWEDARQMVLDRMESENLVVRDRGDRRVGQQSLTFADIHCETEPATRTDDGEPVGPRRSVVGRGFRAAPAWAQWSRLLADIGAFCQGCGRDYEFDPRVLQVDYVRPRSDGGKDAYENLTLLCVPWPSGQA